MNLEYKNLAFIDKSKVDYITARYFINRAYEEQNSNVNALAAITRLLASWRGGQDWMPQSRIPGEWPP